MARLITTNAARAFMNGRKFKNDNTTVELSENACVVTLRLHGNAIARRDLTTGVMQVSNGGWNSNTTKERLNGLPGVSVNQKAFAWYLNGLSWDGSWTTV